MKSEKGHSCPIFARVEKGSLEPCSSEAFVAPSQTCLARYSRCSLGSTARRTSSSLPPTIPTTPWKRSELPTKPSTTAATMCPALPCKFAKLASLTRH